MIEQIQSYAKIDNSDLYYPYIIDMRFIPYNLRSISIEEEEQ